MLASEARRMAEEARELQLGQVATRIKTDHALIKKRIKEEASKGLFSCYFKMYPGQHSDVGDVNVAVMTSVIRMIRDEKYTVKFSNQSSDREAGPFTVTW